nr:uncharacterized protein CFP56_09934 [Quercus suber]
MSRAHLPPSASTTLASTSAPALVRLLNHTTTRNMPKSLVMVVALAIAATGRATALIGNGVVQQQPLAHQIDAHLTTHVDLIEKLKQAEIIPSVLDTFTTQLSLHVSWQHATAKLGTTISPSEMQKPPSIAFTRPSLVKDELAKPPPQLTLALTDPDAPSHSDPRWSQVCHWIATQLDPTSDTLNLTDVMPYKPPGPPPKTGKHRYVFVVLAPLNGTRERLNLRKPAERFHWGYDDGKGNGRDGLRTWAAEMGLGVVGKSFSFFLLET